MGLSRLASLAILLILCLACRSEAKFNSESYYTRSNFTGSLLLFESFTKDWTSRWLYSEQPKYTGRFYVTTPEHDEEAITIADANKHYAMSTLLQNGPLHLGNETIVIQYEAQFSRGYRCGGTYLKFLSKEPDMEDVQRRFDNETAYTLMFGPDKCGGTPKVHLILRHRDPKTGKVLEKKLREELAAPDNAMGHVYTLIIRPELSFQVMIDGVVERNGDLLTDLDPPLIPARMIPDPNDKKPEDWVDEPMISDPNAVKPENWDQPEYIINEDAKKPGGWLENAPHNIPDLEAVKPEEWDDEEDGEWMAPLIPNPSCQTAPGCGPWKPPRIRNPAFKGPWSAPIIENPAYQGPWRPRMIANDGFYEDPNPLAGVAPIAGVGFEIMTIDEGYIFDNILIGVGEDGEEAAEDLRDLAWRPKFMIHKRMAENLDKVRSAEARRKARSERPKTHLADSVIEYLEQDRLKGYLWFTHRIIDALEESPNLAYPLVYVPMVLFLIWGGWVVARPQVKAPRKRPATASSPVPPVVATEEVAGVAGVTTTSAGVTTTATGVAVAEAAAARVTTTDSAGVTTTAAAGVTTRAAGVAGNQEAPEDKKKEEEEEEEKEGNEKAGDGAGEKEEREEVDGEEGEEVGETEEKKESVDLRRRRRAD